MSTKVTSNKHIKINGSGTASGGTFDEVKINGSGKVVGDVECQLLKIDGSGNIEGAVKAETIKISGSGSINGNISADFLKVNGSSSLSGSTIVNKAIINGSSKFSRDVQVKEEFQINGSSKVKGSVTGGNVIVNGSFGVKEDCEVEEFLSNGALDINGLLSADKIKITIGHQSSVKEIGGEQISVSESRVNNIFDKFLRLIFQRNDVLNAEIIEADDIKLEVTSAKLVRGKRVYIGEKCDIENIEYTETLDIHESAKVGRSEKI